MGLSAVKLIHFPMKLFCERVLNRATHVALIGESNTWHGYCIVRPELQEPLRDTSSCMKI